MRKNLQADEGRLNVTFLGLPLRISADRLPDELLPIKPLPPKNMEAWCKEIGDAQ